MNSDTGTVSRPCGDACGTLPPCAPLAVPYVPFQQEGSHKYNQTDALANGTIFPSLNLPFHLKADASALPDSHSAQLQALLFVITELGCTWTLTKKIRRRFSFSSSMPNWLRRPRRIMKPCMVR